MLLVHLLYLCPHDVKTLLEARSRLRDLRISVDTRPKVHGALPDLLRAIAAEQRRDQRARGQLPCQRLIAAAAATAHTAAAQTALPE